jgi:hypothetical protein
VTPDNQVVLLVLAIIALIVAGLYYSGIWNCC